MRVQDDVVSRPIQRVCCVEPMREGEIPVGYAVGYEGVTRIKRVTEDFGQYGIVWFQVWKGEHAYCELNAINVSEVVYKSKED